MAEATDNGLAKLGTTAKLRDDIMVGTFRIGEWLRQIDLQDRYAAPRFTVRQALSELAAAGLVEHVPNRGFRVATFSRELRNEITDTRLLLEIPSVDFLIEHAVQADVDNARIAAEAFHQAVEMGSHSDMLLKNHTFHKEFMAPIQNNVLKQQINELRERNISGGTQSWASVSISNQDHFSMVDALQSRNSETLKTIIHKHLTRWRSTKD